MDNRQFNGDRLKAARIIRGMTLTELAEKTYISKQSVSLYENNKNVPDYGRVVALARTLAFPPDFFFGKDKNKTLTTTTYFRSQSTATKKARQAQSAKLELVAKMYDVLFQYLEFPEFKNPKIEFNGFDTVWENNSDEAIFEIESAAEKVRKCWNIPDGPIEDFQYTLEQNGVLVTGFKSVGESIDAFSQITDIDDSDVYLIGLDLSEPRKSVCRMRFDMAHELAHILLHPWSEDIDSIPKDDFRNREDQANKFASALLLPKAQFGREVGRYPTDLRYYEYLKKTWGVSIQAMLMRAHQLKYLTDNQYQYLMRQVSKKGWRMREPGDKPYEMNESIFQNALDVLFENNILTPQTLLREFKRNGISLYPEDIEEFLRLRDGSLVVENEKVIPLIQLRAFNVSDDES